MNRKIITNWFSALFAIIASFVLIWWFTFDPVQDFQIFVPGMDNRPANMISSNARVDMGTIYASFTGQPSKLKGCWPRFRGKDYDNINKENIRLEEKFTGGPPEILWSVNLGEGHAGPVVADGKVYLMDYNEEENADLLRCFSLDDGKEIWQTGYGIDIKRNHGISRTVPAVSGKYVVAIGPKCHVMCVDSDSGKFIWGIDLVAEYNAEVPLWYTGQCPLIDDSLAIIATVRLAE
jgi:outer membrane protein assembly factor BamB